MNPITNVDVPIILLTSRYLFFSIANSFDLKSKAMVAGITAKLIMLIASLISLNSGNAIRSMSDKTKYTKWYNDNTLDKIFVKLAKKEKK